MRFVARFAVSSCLAVSAFVAAPVAAHAAGCSGADRMPAAMSASAANHATLCLLNQQRRAHGLRSLRNDGRLGRAAAGHAHDMVNQHFFDHTSRNGATFASRIKHTGWTKSRRAYTIGENIGWGGGDLATPRNMVNAWMHSAGHRANILSRSFRLIGIGIANGAPTGGDGATYATDFGG
jgi:uncharacterized protein YkwD